MKEIKLAKKEERGKIKDTLVSQKRGLFFDNLDRWLTTLEASRYLGISENALRILVFRKKIKAYKFNRRLRFRAVDLRSCFQERS